MRNVLRWVGMGMTGLSLLGVVWRDPAPSVAALPPSVLHAAELAPSLRTPARGALREAAFWISLARQAAADACDARGESLRQWDPAAPFDERATRRELLVADASGYLQRARRAVQRAGSLARTLDERRRALDQERLLDTL